MSKLQIDVIRCELARDCDPILKQVGIEFVVGYANELNEYFMREYLYIWVFDIFNWWIDFKILIQK